MSDQGGRLGKTYWHHRHVVTENVLQSLMHFIAISFPHLEDEMRELGKQWDAAIENLNELDYPPDEE